MYYVWGKPSISRPTQTRPLPQPATYARRREKGKRKRQNFVWSPEEEVWHEPYMHCLQREFSDASIRCDSTLELPWKDIALPLAGMRIRPEVRVEAVEEIAEIEEKPLDEPEMKESTGKMQLPWGDLLVAEVAGVQPTSSFATCDSTVEIPWSQLAMEEPPEIIPPSEETCSNVDIEIPWEDILIPRSIKIQGKSRKHPSNVTRRPQKSCDPCHRCPKEKKITKKPAVMRCPGPAKIVPKQL